MMTKSISLRLAALFLLGLLFASCSGDEQTDGPNGSPDSLSTELSEEDKRTNDMPDEAFNKRLARDTAEVTAPEGNLKMIGKIEPMIDAVINRQSIVTFGNEVGGMRPDDMEFQERQKLQYEGPEGWKAYASEYLSKPSNTTFYIVGAFKGDEHHWTAVADTAEIVLRLRSVVAGPKIYGTLNEHLFELSWDGDNAATMKIAPDEEYSFQGL